MTDQNENGVTVSKSDPDPEEIPEQPVYPAPYEEDDQAPDA